MKKTIIIIISLMLIIVLSYLIIWGFIGSGAWIMSILGPKPAQPKVQYGEFPFKLVYEYGDKRIIIEDTIVIEYIGVKYSAEIGYYNAWNRYLKNSGNDFADPILFDDFVKGKGSVRIYYELGSCEYYMGLQEVSSFYTSFNINPGDIIIDSPDGTYSITDEELQTYGISIIEKSISQPINYSSK